MSKRFNKLLNTFGIQKERKEEGKGENTVILKSKFAKLYCEI